MKLTGDFPEMLRDWRARRGMSQLQLAHDAGVSQRHISFLELARSRPSREMVLRLSASLGVPLRDQNDLLLAAGHAPAWSQDTVDSEKPEMLDRAVDYMLNRHDPYPAFILDRQWNLLRVNRGGAWFAGHLTEGPPVVTDPEAPVNLADAFIGPGSMRRVVLNWEDTARYFLHAVRKDYLADGTPETGALLERLLGYPGARTLYESPESPPMGDAALTFDTDDGTIKLRVFTTLATLGTPLTVAAQEIRIEYFFPADKATEQVFLSLGSGRPGPD